MFDYKLERIFSYTAHLTAPEVIGELPEGLKVNVYITGGPLEGPGVSGKLRAEGGDWIVLRRDGVAILDVKLVAELDDGALVLITYSGVIDFGPDGYQRFLKGDLPEALPIRIAPRLSTSHEKHLWMNRVHCLGIGEFRPADGTAAYDIYAVR